MYKMLRFSLTGYDSGNESIVSQDIPDVPFQNVLNIQVRSLRQIFTLSFNGWFFS